MNWAAQSLRTAHTEWTPQACTCTLNVALDAQLVPSSAQRGLRLDMARMVVLDNFIDGGRVDLHLHLDEGYPYVRHAHHGK